ncbi:alkane 1-monooxygenase [Rhodobacterales bacterium HKCCE2091]|nr:alkane 1-monooxygenase [Rhodobacterales bacterium HKCCE2091]
MPVPARYALATLPPFLLIVAGSFLGGVLPLLALMWLTLLGLFLDRLLDPPARAPDDPWAERLSAGLAVAHLALIPTLLMGLDNGRLSAGAQLALFLAAGSFLGQVSHPNAHELIHRGPRWLRSLGATVYATMLFGFHVSAHRLVHHRHVGTEMDPATPLPGESFWAYVPRAWIGSAEAGFWAEAGRLERMGLPAWHPRNPYWVWTGGALIALLLAAVMGGLLGILAYVALCAVAQLQILVSDYVQHYGLQRLVLSDGRVEPVAAHHSWDAPRGFSSLLMLNAPSHSEHHLHPSRRYTELGQDGGAPRLPYSMPVMAVAATVPSLWFHLMDRRALKVMEAAEARLARAA